jgi:GNAT superfamily N-acetyltransferase
MAAWMYRLRGHFLMEIEIRRAVPSDLLEILDLMAHFADHVSLRDQLTVTEDRLSEAVFGEKSFVELLVASELGHAVGYAIYYPHFSSFRGEQGLYLEDIFVAERCRGRGVGLAIIKYIARQAAERGFCRIDFQVLNTNTGALKFYDQLGAEMSTDEYRLKIAGTAFEKLTR